MGGCSLLSCVAARVAPSLLSSRRDDPDAFLRHLQLAARDFIARFQSPEEILTPYVFEREQRQRPSNSNNTNTTTTTTNNNNNNGLAVGAAMAEIEDEVKPLQMALVFPLGENEPCNQMHLFELNIFLSLLCRPRQDYSNIFFWSSLVEKLEELDFCHVMQRNISRLWEWIKQQGSELEIYKELHLLQISCDVVFFFSEHMLRNVPNKDVLYEFSRMAEEMWMDSTSLMLRRCSLVLSVFLSKYSSMFSLESLCRVKENTESPHLLIVLAGVPALREERNDNTELLRAALEVVFTTTVYSIPVATYFRSEEGTPPDLLSFVRYRFASVLHDLFSRVSSKFWTCFTETSLISALEGIAMYTSLWDTLPSGVYLLKQHIRHFLTGGLHIYNISLFNFYTAAVAYHVDFEDLMVVEEGGGGEEERESGKKRKRANIRSSPPRYITCRGMSVEGYIKREDEDGKDEDEEEEKRRIQREGRIIHSPSTVESAAAGGDAGGVMLPLSESPLKETFRILSLSWKSFRGKEKVFVRSAFLLLHALLWNYSRYQKEIETMIGYNMSSLLHHISITLFTDYIYDVDIIEIVYHIVSTFYNLLGNFQFITSQFFKSDFIKNIGLKYERTEIIFFQLSFYNKLLTDHQDSVISMKEIVQSLVYIQEGLIPFSSFTMRFFIQWLIIIQNILLLEDTSSSSSRIYSHSSSHASSSCSSYTSSLLSLLCKDEENHKKFIHRLCEGLYLLLRELQSGNIFLYSIPIVQLIETVIHLLSTIVCIQENYNILSTCVVTIYGYNTVSACFMLYSLLFSSHTSTLLVESVAELLCYMVEHSREKFFTTLRFHTSQENRRNLLSFIEQELKSSLLLSSSSSSSPLPPQTGTTTGAAAAAATVKNFCINATRLMSLRYLLRSDPATFYYLMTPEEEEEEKEKNARKTTLSNLPLIFILRDVVRCVDVSPLEKTEAFELLRSLEDFDISITEASNVLTHTKCDVPFVQCALTSAIINYMCSLLLYKVRVEGNQMSSSVMERGGAEGVQSSPDCANVHAMKNKVLGVHAGSVTTMLDRGCEVLQKCIHFYKHTEEELCRERGIRDSCLSSLICNNNNNNISRGDMHQILPSRVSHEATSFFSVAHNNNNNNNTTGTGAGVSVLFPGKSYDAYKKLKPMLLGDNFFLVENTKTIHLNRMASALEAINRLTASLEAVAWLTYDEKDASCIKLLEVSLSGVQMVERHISPLHPFMSSCLVGWLSLGCAASSVHLKISAESILALSTVKLNDLFRDFVRILMSNRDNIDVVCQGLNLLSSFQPPETTNDGTVTQIFELISDVVEKHATRGPSHSLARLILGCSLLYSRLGKYAPLRCALRTVEGLWSCATHISYLIPVTESSHALSDFFDDIIGAIITILLQCKDLILYFSRRPVMDLANALGQFNNSVCYDPLTNSYQPQAWHRAWLSVLHLLYMLFINTESSGSNRIEWLSAVSTLATTSSRFQDAVSGFMSLSNIEDRKLFHWELREMQLCTSIIALLARFGILTSLLVPHVRRCFCHIRRYSIQVMATMDERDLETLLVTTVRHQLYYLIQQSPPPAFSEDDLFIVSIQRYYTSRTGRNSSSLSSLSAAADVGVLPEQYRRRYDKGEDVVETETEELLSFDALRSFILRELKIIRKIYQDDSSASMNTIPPASENNSSLYSSFDTHISSEALVETGLREGHSSNIVLHVENVQLALVLFVQYARIHITTRTLVLLERQELSVTFDKLLHALNRLIHGVRCLGNDGLTWIVESVREELKSLAGILQNS